ncbi:6-carboxytetrahydropterin synthase [Thalassotalea ponticola]|uniref:6-carboxytetrahydropterin synthase n=1 Tax=Thalassotalea ponticola TaxID=1523392 RepID=UPI0025B5FA2B|nr:6-carboxytetrahydropterin synthase [Thalassotalea ponticola]MDN3651506.1 6-carboxytetrahydropterin synthase [Thalassotalea ponticola]
MQLFVNDLTVIDFSYLCEERGVVGESWIVDVLLSGDLNAESMVLDFGIVKKQIKAIIDDSVDHKLVLPANSNALVVTESKRSEHLYVDFNGPDHALFLQSPKQAFVSIDTDKITEESVTRYLETVIKQQLPENVQGIKLGLRAEVIDGDYYHYTHGLKKHDGNCQRIAHGHRSKISIYRDGEIARDLERDWAKRWADIYLATDSDQVSFDEVELSEVAKANIRPDHLFFSYYAPQGRFDIAVQKHTLEIVDCDSTVELLADYIARQLKQKAPQHTYQVVAYEGVGKGAIASA